MTSALSLCDILDKDCSLQAWSLPVRQTIDEQNRALFNARGIDVKHLLNGPEFPAGANLLFHMGEYPLVFERDAEAWRPVLKRAGSVQISINYNVSTLPQHRWLADCPTTLYFQNNEMINLWQRMTGDTPQRDIPMVMLPPPVDIAPFLKIPPAASGPLVIGLLSGSAWLAPGALDFYRDLARRLPEAEFWFMPTAERKPSLTTPNRWRATGLPSVISTK